MKQARLDRIIKEQTIIAQRVLNCVPKSEPWTKRKIHIEAARQGIQQGIKVVDGCLKSLCDSGLIKEPKPGSFVQVSATPDSPKLESVKAKPKADIMTDKNDKTDPFETMRTRLDYLESIIGKFTSSIIIDISDMRGMLDEAELKCMEKSESVDDELKKLRIFKSTMKEFLDN